MLRRSALRLVARAGLASAGGFVLPSAGAVPAGVSVNVVADFGADPTGTVDSSGSFQLAFDYLLRGGGTLNVPQGVFRIDRTVSLMNSSPLRRSGITVRGVGRYSSIIRSFVGDGPVFDIRGVPSTSVNSTTFFWGGGFHGLGFEAAGAAARGGRGLDVLGWWFGELLDCRFSGYGSDCLRVLSDLSVNPNPDFTASTLFVRYCSFERCGGFGFRDFGGGQSAPTWSWDRCIFVLCRLGGGFVRSSAHSFTKCSFMGCGWAAEIGSPANLAYGLAFDGSATVSARHLVEGCEFDNNLTAHISARNLSSCSFVNNRFIFGDRFGLRRLSPSVGVSFGADDSIGSIQSSEFIQSFFRFDAAGDAVGFLAKVGCQVVDSRVDRSMFVDNTLGRVTVVRFKGFEALP